MWSGVRTQPWTEWSHVFFVSFMSPPDRRISRKSSSNLKLVIWRWIARGTANEPRMIRNVLCFFDAYHLSWFQLFQFWLLCFIKSFCWTYGTKIHHVCREEATNLSAHVSSDIPSISQYTSNWPAKITNSRIQYLIINQLHIYIYICRLLNVFKLQHMCLYCNKKSTTKIGSCRGVPVCQGGADPSPARHKVLEWFCVGIRHGAAPREYMIHIDTC